MESPGGSASASADDALAVFDGLDDPCAPLAAAEVAEELGWNRQNARGTLADLADDGRLNTTEIDGSRVWWRPVDRRDGSPAGQRDEFRALVNGVEEYAIFMLDSDGTVRTWNAGAEQIKGYAEEEIVGEHFSTFYTDEDREAAVPARNLRTAEVDGQVEDEGWRVRKDGSRFWANVTITRVEDDDGELRGFAKVTRDMTERKRREDHLAALNETARELMETESRDAVVDVAIDAAEDDFDFPAAAIALYDEDDGVLRIDGRTALAERLSNEFALFDTESDVLWDVFGEREPRVETDFDRDARSVDGEVRITAGAAVPLGRHGVLTVGFSTPNEPSEAEVEFPKLLAADVEAALDHAERRRLLVEREATLEEQNETLERLNRINGIIRKIDTALVDATDREEIEQAVCDRLATESSYRFAWIGRPGSSAGEITPAAWAGDGSDRVDDLAKAIGDGSSSQQPAAAAARSREPHAVEALRSDPPFETWRKEALKRGYRSVLSVPLLYEDSLYGVLTVFADRSDVFSGMERRVIEELGGTIAHAINALESKRALVSDEVVELEFRVRDSDIAFIRLVEEADCEFEFENVVTHADDSYRGYFVTRNVSPEDVDSFAARSPSIEALRLLADDDGESLFECTLTSGSLVASLLDHGAVPRSIEAADGEGRVVVTMARDADVREFADMLAAKYPDSELTARRTRQRRDRTHHTFKADFESRLTERQRETLETAYFSGFFDSPRKRTGQEIGETLGVSQPTVNHHLRASQRKLLGMLYEDDRPDEATKRTFDSR